jgi:CRISPR-associated protein Cmr6
MRKSNKKNKRNKKNKQHLSSKKDKGSQEMDFFLPKKTVSIFKKLIGDIRSEKFSKVLSKMNSKINENKINLSLSLNKYYKLIEEIVKESKKSVNNNNDNNKAKKNNKGKKITIFYIFSNYTNNFNILLKDKIHIIDKRQREISDEIFELETKSRLVVGLGSESVLEVSIKLHHIYGIPYIPSSAIKGVLRAYKMWEMWELFDWREKKFIELEKMIDNYNNFDSSENNEKLNTSFTKDKDEDIAIRDIVEVFGNKNRKGRLIFLDAYPVEFNRFDIDVMNPHYTKYYGGDEAPSDWQNPSPIKFLAIPRGIKFRFYFKNAKIYKDIFGNELQEDLKKAFYGIGIGGKTSLGYGFLS